MYPFVDVYYHFILIMSDEKITKIKVIDLGDLYNFVVDDFSI